VRGGAAHHDPVGEAEQPDLLGGLQPGGQFVQVFQTPLSRREPVAVGHEEAPLATLHRPADQRGGQQHGGQPGEVGGQHRGRGGGRHQPGREEQAGVGRGSRGPHPEALADLAGAVGVVGELGLFEVRDRAGFQGDGAQPAAQRAVDPAAGGGHGGLAERPGQPAPEEGGEQRGQRPAGRLARDGPAHQLTAQQGGGGRGDDEQAQCGDHAGERAGPGQGEQPHQPDPLGVHAAQFRRTQRAPPQPWIGNVCHPAIFDRSTTGDTPNFPSVPRATGAGGPTGGPGRPRGR
jgi:hypothetical protein